MEDLGGRVGLTGERKQRSSPTEGTNWMKSEEGGTDQRCNQRLDSEMDGLSDGFRRFEQVWDGARRSA
jgi:hypothetical protein